MTQAFKALNVKVQGIDGHLAFIEPASRKITVEFAGELIASSTEALIMHETNHQPVYYFPRNDVRFDLLKPSDRLTH